METKPLHIGVIGTISAAAILYGVASAEELLPVDQDFQKALKDTAQDAWSLGEIDDDLLTRLSHREREDACVAAVLSLEIFSKQFQPLTNDSEMNSLIEALHDLDLVHLISLHGFQSAYVGKDSATECAQDRVNDFAAFKSVLHRVQFFTARYIRSVKHEMETQGDAFALNESVVWQHGLSCLGDVSSIKAAARKKLAKAKADGSACVVVIQPAATE